MMHANPPTSRPNSLFSEMRMPRVLEMLRRRFRSMSLVALLGLTGAIGYLYVAVPQYTAQAMLTIGSGDTRLGPDGRFSSAPAPIDLATIRTQVEMLESWAMSAHVVEKLGLVETPHRSEKTSILTVAASWIGNLYGRLWRALGLPEPAADAEIHNRLLSAVEDFQRGLSVVTDGRSYVIQVRYRSEDPRFAADAANALAEDYLGDQLAYKSEATGRLSRWLTQRSEAADGRLRDAELALSQFRQQHNIADAKGLTVTQQQLAELNSQLVLATAELAQREARARNLKEIARSGVDSDAAPEVLASPLIQLLRDQEARLVLKISESANRYGDKYPNANEARAEITDLRRKIAVEVGKIAQSVTVEADVARAHVVSLRGTIDGLQRSVSSASAADAILRGLQQQVEAARTDLASYQAHSVEAGDHELLIRPDARLVSPAIRPIRPSSPKTLLVILLGLGSGLIVGVMLAALRDRLDDGARGVAQVEAVVGIPCLGLMPRLGRHRRSGRAAAAEVIDYPDSPYSEAIWSVLVTLSVSVPVHGAKVVLVTSAMPGAGTTGFAVALARSAAKAGHRALLIDCNLRGPAVARTLQCEDGHGLDALIAGERPTENPIREDLASGLNVLPTRASMRIHDMLSSPVLPGLVDEARRHHDLVVLDGPALMQGPDSLVLCQLADFGLVLVPWSRIRINALLRALHRVAVPNGKQLATLLTDVPFDRYRRYLRGQAM
jgi:uncharacterized protein involved in exopolysaccharide biosynthesis/Mrp family chromosome partitioning ATPase